MPLGIDMKEAEEIEDKSQIFVCLESRLSSFKMKLMPHCKCMKEMEDRYFKKLSVKEIQLSSINAKLF